MCFRVLNSVTAKSIFMKSFQTFILKSDLYCYFYGLNLLLSCKVPHDQVISGNSPRYDSNFTSIGLNVGV